KHARRPVGERFEAYEVERVARSRLALAARHPGRLERVKDIGGGRATQHDRALKYHRLAALHGSPSHAARSGREQAMADAHQHALARAVGAKDHGARAGGDLRVHAVEDRATARDEAHFLQVEREQRAHPYLRCAASLTMKAAALRSSTSRMRTMPRLSAS